MGRAPCCDKANVKKGPWSPEEDAKLKAYIEQYGTGGNWIALPQKIGLKRCGKSCRLRWLNYLRPNIKHGGFSEEEDNIICNLYISIGSRWSIIAAQLPGRTDNDIKNYWNTKLKKKLLGRRKQSNRSPNANGVEDSTSSQTLSNSALERLQLHMRLQRLQDPFYNNLTLWPKLYPLLQSMNESSNNNPNMQVALPSILHMENPQKVPENCAFNALENSSPTIASSNNVMSSNVVPISNAILQPVSNLGGSEFEDFVNNKNSGFTQLDDQIPGFDYFKEMNNVSKDNLMWWSNEFETRSTSSNSWESNSVFPSQGIFQDYELGYNM